MKMNITVKLVETTLANVHDGFKFEKFSQVFMSAISDNTYKPVGGTHDGGADGINEDSGLFEEESKNYSFTQISIEKNSKNKIEKTLLRLKNYEREVKKLTYITSIVVKDIDKIEDEISDKYNIRLVIRDAKYIASNINYSHQTEKAFEEILFDTYDHLKIFGDSSLVKKSTLVEDNNLAFLFSFIQNELNNKKDRKSLTTSLTDSLILWSLEGTDPDKKIFMSEKEILNKILETLPTTKTFIKSLFSDRLKNLTQQRTSEGRQKVQFYKKQKIYCLPYETRNDILQKNIIDEGLFLDIKNQLNNKIIDFDNTLTSQCIESLIQLVFNTLNLIFKNEGLEFTAFIQNPEKSFMKKPMNYIIDEVFEGSNITDKIDDKKEIISKVINYIFYQTDDLNIKTYLHKLSETYILLLSLKADGRIVDYFEKMSSNFNLIIGSDILVRALSETLLQNNNKPNTNILKILNEANAKLRCTDYIIDEVWNNIKTSDFEYKNHFAKIEQYMKIEIARESSKILIRSYFYNKLSNTNKQTLHWNSFIERFCDYDKLHTSSGFEQIKKYLINKFNLDIIDKNEIDRIIQQDELLKLKNKLKDTKKTEILENNSATTVNLVYAIRSENKESSNGNKFGYKTWWLTNERTTMRYTKELSKKYNSFYIIRPEFLLHYISLIPSKKDVKQTYQAIFPTVMGIKMSGRISIEEYNKLLNRLKEASKYDNARLKVKIEEEVDRLKGDFIREYESDDDILS